MRKSAVRSKLSIIQKRFNIVVDLNAMVSHHQLAKSLSSRISMKTKAIRQGCAYIRLILDSIQKRRRQSGSRHGCERAPEVDKRHNLRGNTVDKLKKPLCSHGVDEVRDAREPIE